MYGEWASILFYLFIIEKSNIQLRKNIHETLGKILSITAFNRRCEKPEKMCLKGMNKCERYLEERNGSQKAMDWQKGACLGGQECGALFLMLWKSTHLCWVWDSHEVTQWPFFTLISHTCKEINPVISHLNPLNRLTAKMWRILCTLEN